MKTTSRILTGCMASGLTLLSGLAWAGPHAGPVMTFLATSATGQTELPASGDEARRQVVDLLARARQAMDEGNLQTADSLLSRAESAKVTFGLFYVGDTPKKARRDLDRQLKAQGGSVKKPSELFAAGAKEPVVNQPSAATDPFASRASTKSTPSVPATGLEPPPEQGRSPLGADPDQFPERSPFGRPLPSGPPPEDPGDPRYDRYSDRYSDRAPAADPRTADRTPDNRLAAGDPRQQSDELLLTARRALALGDVRQATEAVNQAKALRVNYEFHDDSPAKVESAVQKYVGLSERDPRDKKSESYRRQYAEALMQQAEALIGWNEFDEAERLAGDAQRMGVNYGPFDAQPKTLLDRIAAARQGGPAAGRGASGMEPLPPVNDRAESPRDPAGSVASNPADKAEVLRLVKQARKALAAGDLPQAEALAQQAEEMRVPDAAFAPEEDRPWLVLLQVQKQRRGGVSQASAAAPIASEDQASDRYAGRRAVYDGANDRTQNVPASSEETSPPDEEDAITMYLNGEEALRKHDTPTALEWFKRAYALRDELDPVSQQRLQDHLQFLAQPSAARRPAGESLMNEAAAAQQVQYRQVSAELSRQEELARQVREKNPKQALAMLQQARAIVEKSTLESTARDVLLRRVDRGVEELERHIEGNRSQIDLAERNAAVLNDIEREGAVKVEVQEKLALLVDQFNKLMDEHRFAEAEVVAKRAAELAPNELVVTQLKYQSKFAMRTYNAQSIRDLKENGFVEAMASVDQSSIPTDDRFPLQFGDVKNWERITKSRRQLLRDGRSKRSEKEIEIEQRLRTPVSCRFQEAPLSQVIDSLGKLAQVNVHLDQRGLAEEGVTTDTPVTIDLSQDISLKSALNLILDPLHLSFVIKDEVLKITSEQLRDGEIYPQTYHVADLVIPIPNFVPSGNMGLAGALRDAQGGVNGAWGGMGGSSPMPVVASTTGAKGSAVLDPRLLAQMNSVTGGGSAMVGSTQPVGSGPGGLGGGAQPDFESLIELITSTIAPTTWDEVGGPGAIQEFAGNLSLVISQTQEVHEEIADLLEQLRRLQDLQVTIEVRFITLNDNFFERIGVDFDFDINDNLDKPFQIFGTRSDTNRIFTQPPTANQGQARDVSDRDLNTSQSVTVGMSAPGVFSSDLDIPFTQGSFPLAVPQFGNYAPGAGAQLGFAILSDLETYFFIEAATGDRRSNVLQAPKVTLFNGQQAFVSDTSQSPFVISVIPVVGDFAAANQPVIVVLNEGTHLTVQAVVSSDRRFVRLTVVPFFSRIGKVDTFTFEGSSSTTDETGSEGPDDNPTSQARKRTTSSQGTTVQLPTFSFVTVTTTVSVPDGGTVLLGGIKRLSEGRNEFGVPMLNKLPYINRLFRNVGIGRETQSLMMMVTPRIIIQEEEEALLGIPTPP